VSKGNILSIYSFPKDVGSLDLNN